MPVRLGFLRTRVGRRFLTGNLLAALVPLIAVCGLSIYYLRSALLEQSQARVTRLSKSLTLSTLATLTDARRELRNQPFAPGNVASSSSTFLDVKERDASDGVDLLVADGGIRRPFTEDELARLQARQVVLFASTNVEDAAVWLAYSIGGWSAGRRPLVWVRLNPEQLWSGLDETIGGEDASYCVFETRSFSVLHCSVDMPSSARSTARAVATSAATSHNDGSREGFFVSSRDVYLRHEFGAPEWQVVALQLSDLAMRPLHSFERLSILLMLAIAILIFVVSHAQIRRTTEPLARLQEGTRRLQQGDFTRPVIVTSDDEYAEVAESFNGMSRTLDRQLALLRNIDAVDHAAMTSRETRAVIDEALGRFCSSQSCSRVTIAVVSQSPRTLDVTTIDPLTPVSRTFQRPLAIDDERELLDNPRQLFLAGASRRRGYLPSSETSRSEDAVLVLPLVHDGGLIGLIALGCPDATTDHSSEVTESRRLADRVALALSHVRLMDELHALSVGTLTAFARAIDANSPWTAGHSERVTRAALALGHQLSLSAEEMQTLERGGLLHDIGKIAVPASVLDKPGKLDAQELQVMQRHPAVGYEILTPIPAFAAALPVVRSHHERLDGTGYPDGLRGDEIPWLARILAVADVFDALVSDRPYRAGLTLDKACDIIRDSAGHHLDPRVVRTFLELVRTGRIRVEHASSESSQLAAEFARARDTHATVA